MPLRTNFAYNAGGEKIPEQEGFLRCQTPASTVRGVLGGGFDEKLNSH